MTNRLLFSVIYSNDVINTETNKQYNIHFSITFYRLILKRRYESLMIPLNDCTNTKSMYMHVDAYRIRMVEGFYNFIIN